MNQPIGHAATALSGGDHLNGNNMKVDEVTGYLTLDVRERHPSVHGFTSDKKVLFITLCKTEWPNFSKVCDAVGIHRTTFRNHYIIDAKFKQDVDACKYQALDDIKTEFTKRGRRGEFMQGISVLRAYDDEVQWNPNSQVTITHQIDNTEAHRRMDAMRDVVDVDEIKGEHD